MRLISHRGYVNGEDSSLENDPAAVQELLDGDIDVEVDVWYIEGQYFLGHDQPNYLVDESFLLHKGLWCHAKNREALQQMINSNIHCFWHQSDDFTITSKGYIWAFPGKETNGKKTVMLFPERNPDIDYEKYDFVCTDYLKTYSKGVKNGNKR